MSKRRATAGNDATTLAAYLREITGLPRLTTDEERELGRRIRHEQDDEALAHLVECNLRFVVTYAKRYRGLGISFLDLIHEGNVGLIEAAKRFDASDRAAFMTSAVWWIRQAILQALSEQAQTSSLPPRLASVAARWSREVASLAASFDQASATVEAAEELHQSTAPADALMRLPDVSLNDPLGLDGRGLELGETVEHGYIPPIEDELVLRESVEALAAALLELDGKKCENVRLRYGFDANEPGTLQESGSRLHLSRERVRQLDSRAKEKLRRSAKLRSHLN